MAPKRSFTKREFDLTKALNVVTENRDELARTIVGMVAHIKTSDARILELMQELKDAEFRSASSKKFGNDMELAVNDNERKIGSLTDQINQLRRTAEMHDEVVAGRDMNIETMQGLINMLHHQMGMVRVAVTPLYELHFKNGLPGIRRDELVSNETASRRWVEQNKS